MGQEGRQMRKTAYAQGTPSWIDLSTPDVAATSQFYGSLFGWEAIDAGPDAGGYVTYELDGSPVAGAGPLQFEGQPTFWTTYFAVDDADATAARIQAAGGQMHMAPMDVMDLGRLAMFADPTAAVFGIWQKRSFAGAGVIAEPGTLIWNELLTRDVPAAIEFYGAAFGVTAQESDLGEVPYTELQVDGASVAGVIDVSRPEFAPDLPPHWMVYFAVSDCDQACAKIESLDGSINVPPTDIPLGRFAVVADQHGAFFSIIQMNE
jgi:uncharacterized protein